MRIQFRASWARYAVLLMLPVLGGCATVARDDAAGRPPGPGSMREYLPVNDLPRERDEPLISAPEQDRLKAELLAAQQQAQRVSAKAK